MRIGAAGTIASVSAVSSGAGRTLFVMTTDHGLTMFDQNGWLPPIGAPGSIASVTAATNAQGAPEVFVTTVVGDFQEWISGSGWRTVGARNTILRGKGFPGGVVVVTSGHAIYEFSDTGGWVKFTDDGFADAVDAIVDSAGKLAVYGLTNDGSLSFYTPGSAWTPLGVGIAAISAGTDATGGYELYARTQDRQFYTFANGAWVQHEPPAPLALDGFVAAPGGRALGVFDDGSLYEFNYGGSNQWLPLASAGFAADE